MNRQVLIKNTIKKIKQLPENKIREVSDFTDFLLSKIEDKITLEGLQEIVFDSKAFDFLKEEEEMYSVYDLKEKYK